MAQLYSVCSLKSNNHPVTFISNELNSGLNSISTSLHQHIFQFSSFFPSHFQFNPNQQSTLLRELQQHVLAYSTGWFMVFFPFFPEQSIYIQEIMFALARVLPVHFANCLNIPNAPELHRVGLDLNSVQLERIQNWQEKGGGGKLLRWK